MAFADVFCCPYFMPVFQMYFRWNDAISFLYAVARKVVADIQEKHNVLTVGSFNKYRQPMALIHMIRRKEYRIVHKGSAYLRVAFHIKYIGGACGIQSEPIQRNIHDNTEPFAAGVMAQYGCVTVIFKWIVRLYGEILADKLKQFGFCHFAHRLYFIYYL